VAVGGLVAVVECGGGTGTGSRRTTADASVAADTREEAPDAPAAIADVLAQADAAPALDAAASDLAASAPDGAPRDVVGVDPATADTGVADARPPSDLGVPEAGVKGHRLWIAATISDPVEAHSALIVYDEDQLTRSGPTSGPVASYGPTHLDGYAQIFTIDRSGNVWGQGPGTSPALRRYRARDLAASTDGLPPPDERTGLAGPLQVALPPCLDPQGNLWVPGTAGPVRFDRSQLDLADLAGLHPSLQVNAGAGNEMAVDGQGNLYFNHITQLSVWTAAQLGGSGTTDVPPRYEVHSVGTRVFTTDPRGSLWYVNSGSFIELRAGFFENPAGVNPRYVTIAGSAYPDGRYRAVQGIAFDEAGNAWITAGDNTLAKLAVRDLNVYPPGPNPPSPQPELVITVPPQYRLFWLQWR